MIGLDLQHENSQLKAKIAEYELILSSMSAPVIESFLGNVVLVPLTGILTLERINNIDQAIFDYVAEKPLSECMVIDFTGIDVSDFNYIDLHLLTERFEKLNKTLAIMGIRVLHSGMNPDVVRHFITTGYSLPSESFPSFRTALQQLVRDGYEKAND